MNDGKQPTDLSAEQLKNYFTLRSARDLARGRFLLIREPSIALLTFEILQNGMFNSSHTKFSNGN